MKKYPTITRIIIGAMARNGISAKELSKQTGISYSTIIQQRFPNPGGWRFFEYSALQRAVCFTPDEIQAIEREVRR